MNRIDLCLVLVDQAHHRCLMKNSHLPYLDISAPVFATNSIVERLRESHQPSYFKLLSHHKAYFIRQLVVIPVVLDLIEE